MSDVRVFMHLSQKILAISLIVLTNSTYAGGCSGVIDGQSSKFYITISDDGCISNELLILVSKLDPETSAAGFAVQRELFSKECKFTSDAIICRANGKTILSGTEYKRTFDVNPQCVGIKGSRFTCIKGCKSDVPKYLNENYEC